MITFIVYGPFQIPVSRGKVAKTIEPAQIRAFWKHHEAFSTQLGCYVFGMRTGRGITPLYVGCATKGFKQEIFTSHKVTKYQKAFANYKKGTPVLLLLTALKRKGAPNISCIKELESFLIKTVAAQNPNLLNVKGTKLAAWSINGVLGSGRGKPSEAAKSLRTTLNL